MLNLSNIFCLVGGGKCPKYAPNKLLLWDDESAKEVKEIRLKSNVKNAKIKKKAIFVVCENEITIISTDTFTIIEAILTNENSAGACATSHDPELYIFAWPGQEKGSIQIKDYDDDEREKKIIKAHENTIEILEITYKGDLVATASDKGTIIRIFNISDGTPVSEVRRGTEKPEIFSIAFDIEGNYLGVTSDRGTAHLFVIEKNKDKKKENDDERQKKIKNTTSIFGGVSKMIGLSKFFRSEWSFAQIKFSQGMKAICAILNNVNSFIIVTYKGRYVEGQFDVNQKKKNSMECKIKLDTSLISL